MYYLKPPLSLGGVKGDGNSFTYYRLNRCVISIYEGELRMTTYTPRPNKLRSL